MLPIGPGGLENAAEMLEALGLDAEQLLDAASPEQAADAVGHLGEVPVPAGDIPPFGDAPVAAPVPAAVPAPAASPPVTTGKGASKGRILSAVGLDDAVLQVFDAGLVEPANLDIQALGEQLARATGTVQPGPTVTGSKAGAGGAKGADLPAGDLAGLAAQLAAPIPPFRPSIATAATGLSKVALGAIAAGVAALLVAGALVVSGGGSSDKPAAAPCGSAAGPVPVAVVPVRTWTGRWHAVATCQVKGCLGETDSGTLALVQDGDTVRGTVAEDGDPTRFPITGTASGTTAVISAGDDVILGTYSMTMAADRRSFVGTISATERSTGFTVSLGTIEGSRSGPDLAIGVATVRPTIRLRRTALVVVSVTALDGDVQDVSLGSGLVVSPGLTVTSAPKRLDGFSLADGATRTFVFTVRGVTTGPATVQVDATGTGDSSGNVTGSRSLNVGVL